MDGMKRDAAAASSSLRARLEAEIQKAIEWAESSGQRSQAAEMHGLKTELRESLLKRSQRDMDLARQHAANALSAALDARQAEENQSLREGSTVPVREPEATPVHEAGEFVNIGPGLAMGYRCSCGLIGCSQTIFPHIQSKPATP
jgi:hypothetical protein